MLRAVKYSLTTALLLLALSLPAWAGTDRVPGWENMPCPTRTVIPREHGRIKRSPKAIADFKRLTGYPKGRPGYIVDHVKPLKRGGADAPCNMQWQTIKDAKAKDRWE